MANRNIQQKINKMKRMRRSHLKKYSMKNTGPIRHTGFFNEQGDFVDTSLRTRNKAAVNILDEHLLIKYRFNQKSPEAMYARRAGLHTDLVVLCKYVAPKGASSPHIEDFSIYQNMPDDRFSELRLYLGRTECFFIGFKTENGERVVYTSYPYVDIGRIRGRDLALKAQRDRTILWDTVEKIHTPPPADPNPTGA